MPGVSILRSPNCAMPFTGAALVVPDRLPPTGLTSIVMVTAAVKLESTLPSESRTTT